MYITLYTYYIIRQYIVIDVIAIVIHKRIFNRKLIINDYMRLIKHN